MDTTLRPSEFCWSRNHDDDNDSDDDEIDDDASDDGGAAGNENYRLGHPTQVLISEQARSGKYPAAAASAAKSRCCTVGTAPPSIAARGGRSKQLQHPTNPRHHQQPHHKHCHHQGSCRGYKRRYCQATRELFGEATSLERSSEAVSAHSIISSSTSPSASPPATHGP